MCGIAGLVSFDRPLADSAGGLLAHMLDRLHHRGPDDRGSTVETHVALGNTRLSIVGVDNGHQPIANETGTVVTVMNGEIYNADTLRADLHRKGHYFSTTTDTEVLVHLYEEHGDDLLSHLDGMFVFAIHDRARKRVLIGRDRFGMKPLFYLKTGDRLCFASEIKALKADPAFPTTLCPEGIATYLGLMYIPDPWTAYKDVKKLRPGHFLAIDADGLEDIAYYDVRFAGTAEIGKQDAVEHLADLIPDAVERHLMSDVPVATLLSGGLDSRSVTAAMWQRSAPSSAFTIGYAEGRFDEGELASRWIDRIGGRHERVVLGEQDFADQLRDQYARLDEPYAVWVNGASGILARHIADAGFKVALTGEGGDEFFCGYPTLHAAQIARYYRYLPKPLQTAIQVTLDKLPAGEGRLPLVFMAQSFSQAIEPDIFRTFFGFKEVLRHREWRDALTDEAFEAVGEIDPAIAFHQYRDKIEGWPLIDALSYLDIKVFLAGCSLVPNDNAFMASSVETRIPLLDHRLVDFVTSLPLHHRFSPIEPKALLKRAMRRFVDKAFPRARKELAGYKKMGFEIPTTNWIDGRHLGALIDDMLSSANVKANGFFKPAFVRKLLEDQRAKRRNNERRIQVVLAMEAFLARTGHSF